MSVSLFSRKAINTLAKVWAQNEKEERAIWYGYVANLTAYNLQYRENIPIDYKTEDVFDECEDRIGSLLYNIYTNDGNCFLEDRWVAVLKDIADREREYEEKQNDSIPWLRHANC
ncbi:MAG: hypothetical protein GOVbin568_42 [Prokaryotic dsDNA virus sp.]|nr:MAG: hypothetical protein GOVbin568_42 [Prokaryotic dsDNA virus sp.]|tara:strand:- start:447 stop:791 length:345 start_codon:yes stop_codon:yes gene_type:complete